MELSDLDLNLLLLFQRLMQERRVSTVAEQMNMSQPGVSNALAKLRRRLGDPLFVRGPGGVVPTPFALRLAEPVSHALATLHAALNPETGFDPQHAVRTITIGMTDIGEVVFLPALLERLSQTAPGIVLNTVRNTSVNLGDEMAEGRVDLAIGLLPQLQGGFYQRRLFDQRYVCLFRRGHPLEAAPLTLGAWSDAGHLVVVSAGTGHGQVDEWLKRRRVTRNVRLTVPHFMSVGYILQRTDLIATVPEHLALQLATPFSLSWRALPVTLPGAPIHMLWHARVNQDECNRWLRDVVVELFAEAGARQRKSGPARKK
ncbi:LysR family transcriptional regulator [Burkholderia multivorans]|uniref:LysR family transcriptional regulator n=1 Tax=Burkholderia multivorans TaxID=87883 RepID=UPI0006A604A0|nr:LysR family transcriptional regulator [Burkholderia multivorans]AOJ95404.1 LysR family transcriptional regulator [Burkholderia multivorans]KOE23766.1 LysR family transcriptional regulator [Burkholderia multivorans R-20526]MBU9237742.1 LysR family transcriptional regulator [Burkholderia multivorans]MBU9243712.1 LysR family transcriptional regulator [Burkholderia multivorans]MBU9367679.1 LysR family transcriptional regulator [Burkholderia multivorans]